MSFRRRRRPPPIRTEIACFTHLLGGFRGRAGRVTGVALALLAGGAIVGPAACASGATTSGAGGAGGGADQGGGYVDWGGTTGSGDSELNDPDIDPDLEEDYGDPDDPNCGPDAEVHDDGSCTPSCEGADGECWDGEDDVTDCGGDAPITSHDCSLCCPFPDEDETPTDCDPETGICEDPDDDCDPELDPECTYTEDCPNAVCEVSKGETCSTCPEDCGDCAPSCGDDECNGAEDCSSCPEDCGECPAGAECGDDACDVDAGESCQTCQKDCGKCFKVLTWDITNARRKGTKPATIKKTLTSIGNKIAREKPDFAAIQSIEQGTKRSGCLDMPSHIAKRTNMFKRFGATYRYGDCDAKTKGYIGVALFSKHKYKNVVKVPLTSNAEFDKKRVLLSATMETKEDLLFTFATTKLGSAKKGNRETQAEQILGVLGFNATAILTGNLREESDGPAMEILLSQTLFDAWEEDDVKKKPTANGLTTKKRRIDYVLPGGDWYPPAGAVAAYVLPAKGLSSHRPVVMLFNRDALENGSGSGSGVGGGGFGGGGFGGGDFGGGDFGGGDFGSGDPGGYDVCESPCSGDGDCADNECAFNKCVGGLCAECNSNADCLAIDPEFPTCDADHVCNSPEG